MSFKSWCLGLAVAAVIAPVAEASTYQTYRYGLTYVETFYDDVRVIDLSDQFLPDQNYTVLTASDDPWGLPLYHQALVPGAKFQFELVTWGDRDLVSCMIGPISCTGRGEPYYSGVRTDPITVFSELESLYFEGAAKIGTVVDFYDTAFYLGHIFDFGSYMVNTRGRHSQFVISSIPAVPLPATAALLPIGLSLLALLRRRRKRLV
ncbi:hypothetical protein JJJ17_02670 [Paracoccus caeni]|uniref:VPLPA-CTERM protein sorting domain-containing protein n=1 Tax=Paracoccus caeni TaxID=657651 RepID=A0A934SBS6_9RHOB|nr:hypothetical protein [Paracoccus caeni]MBK4214823.1 hypothetical protein [Paracoccus caeni]